MVRDQGAGGKTGNESGRRLGSTVPAVPSRSYLRNEVRAVKAQKFPQNQGVCASALMKLVALSPEWEYPR